MPNILTHMVTAEAVCPKAPPEVLVGSALPDFIGMYRAYTGTDLRSHAFKVDPALAEGIWLHNRTDHVYDKLAVRKELIQYAKETLVTYAPDLSRGALRGCADMGNDLLMDSVVLDQAEGQRAYLQAKAAVLTGLPALAIGGRDFERGVQRYFQENVPIRYSDSASVAWMIQRRLAVSRRLGFDADTVPAVAEALEQHRERVELATSFLLSQTIEGVRQEVDDLHRAN